MKSFQLLPLTDIQAKLHNKKLVFSFGNLHKKLQTSEKSCDLNIREIKKTTSTVCLLSKVNKEIAAILPKNLGYSRDFL